MTSTTEFLKSSAQTVRRLHTVTESHVLALADVLIDCVAGDPYGELYFGHPPPPGMLALSDSIPGSRDWLAHFGSLSKVLSPGLRIGWVIAPPTLLANATMCKQFSDAHTSNLTQAIAAHYLTLGRMDGALNVVRKTYAERARVMAECRRQEFGDAIEFNQPHGGISQEKVMTRNFAHPLFAALAALLLTSSATHAASAHPCTADATSRAAKLLALQAESDQPGTIAKTVTTLKPVRNPANSKQKFDVLAISGHVYKAEYRMRFVYAQIPGQCALVGQEILAFTGL